ncbi:MAG TPA: alternative ribosome rescue aminoacyl-tRNA hydrolase ArfB [Vicinamibacteria bacterium]|nr:alternative ribosome rescue aminoacyl-tRNA hydrolase ArfB [Vicinamibacteria bacterium]
MPRAIHVAPGVWIPEPAISFRAVRASGPGGQNVNKVASKVELRVDLQLVLGLDRDARERLAQLAAPRLDGEDRLVVTSQRSRDQGRNLEDACAKVRDLVARALVPPRRRRPTRPPAASREARLRDKRLTATRKASRRRGLED